MKYLKPSPFIHILSQPLERKKLELEIIYSSGGSWFESPEDRGKKHLLEHCIASRTKNLNFQELKDLEFRENISLNAYTGPITMGLTATSHYTDFRKITDLLIEMALEPTFDQEILDKEKEIVLREISERRGDPNYRLYYDTSKAIFTPDSYNNHETLGDSEKVALTSLEDFRNLQSQNLNKSHLIISLSGGGIELDYLQEKLQKHLLKNPNWNGVNDKNDINYNAPTQFQDFKFLPVVHELAHSHAEISVFLKCPINLENKAALQVFDSLFLKYGGVLYDRLRDELGLVYGIQSSFDNRTQTLGIELSCEIQYIQKILDEIKSVFGDFNKNFRPQKFNEFKNLIQKRIDIAQDTLGASTNFTESMLLKYGVAQTYGEYSQKLQSTTQEEIESIYNFIMENQTQQRVVVVSKDSAISDLNLSF